MIRSKIKSVFLAFISSVLAISLISFPQESVDASIRGLEMWWQVVFPSLLPFLIISEILIGFGVVKFIGVLFEPLMRPLFRVPGEGGFVWAMGMASGYPAGAKLTARLRQKGELTKEEGERLVSFTNCSNPLFIFGAVSVGFFHNPNLGIILAVAHYLGNFTVGLMMRFHKYETISESVENRRFSIIRAFRELHRARLADNRPIGKLLGDSVVSSIQTLLMIGGFIILFSVINRLLTVLEITPFLSGAIKYFFILLSFPESLTSPFVSGLFEITLGSKLVSMVEDVHLIEQAMIVSFVIGFNGFSVQAQVASILSQTDISFKPYFIARIFHGIFASLFTFLLWDKFYRPSSIQIPGNETVTVVQLETVNWSTQVLNVLQDVGPLLTIFSLIIYIAILTKRNIKNEH